VFARRPHVTYDSRVRLPGIIATVLSLAVGLLPVAAPEHVHEREDHGHAELVVHRHMPPHGVLDHHGAHQASVEDDDAPILTLTTVYNSVWMIDPETGEERLAVQFPQDFVAMFRAAWAQDGKSVIVNRRERTSHIALLENFWVR
jgi:hypothetical protein